MDLAVLCVILIGIGAGWIILTLLLTKLMLYVAYGHTKVHRK